MELQPSAQFPSQKENYVNTTKRLLENWTFRMKTRVFLRYFVRGCNIFNRNISPGDRRTYAPLPLPQNSLTLGFLEIFYPAD